MNFCIDCGKMVEYDDDSHFENREITITVSKHLLEGIIYDLRSVLRSREKADQLMQRILDVLLPDHLDNVTCHKNGCTGTLVFTGNKYKCSHCGSYK